MIFTNSIAPEKDKPALGKLSIASLDDPDLQVTAQYNPKEIQLERVIPWGTNNRQDNRADWRRNDDKVEREYVGATPRSMTIELLFDTYESQTSVEPLVEKLDEMATVRMPMEPGVKVPEANLRPHHCVLVWGREGNAAMRRYRCVIESLSVKYTMFASDGTPLRATCNLKLGECAAVGVDREALKPKKK
ncbi:MAG: hypothetical protein ABI867_07370 [Kofleriaceae bacterium]